MLGLDLLFAYLPHMPHTVTPPTDTAVPPFPARPARRTSGPGRHPGPATTRFPHTGPLDWRA
ncbi:hypothetical protein GCM10009853_043330 [Glycomyces scopariae]